MRAAAIHTGMPLRIIGRASGRFALLYLRHDKGAQTKTWDYPEEVQAEEAVMDTLDGPTGLNPLSEDA